MQCVQHPSVERIQLTLFGTHVKSLIRQHFRWSKVDARKHHTDDALLRRPVTHCQCSLTMSTDHENAKTRSHERWHDLAQRVLDGHRLTADEGLAVLRCGDEELLDLLAAAYRVRHRWFGNRVDLNFLINAKSGLCGEDCGYCSQSRVSRAEIPRYHLITAQEILDGARMAAERTRQDLLHRHLRPRAQRSTSWMRSARPFPQIKAELRAEGLLLGRTADARPGRAAEGLRRRPHQSQPQHQRAVLPADLHHARVPGPARHACGPFAKRAWKSARAGSSAWARRTPTWWIWPCGWASLQAEAVPINFLEPIPGTPLEGVRRLNPRYCLKVLALFRLANPRCELRIAAGREMHLGRYSPWASTRPIRSSWAII